MNVNKKRILESKLRKLIREELSNGKLLTKKRLSEAPDAELLKMISDVTNCIAIIGGYAGIVNQFGAGQNIVNQFDESQKYLSGLLRELKEYVNKDR